MAEKRKVAIYCRVSSMHQAIEGYSIEQQRDSLTKYCEAMEWNIYDIYIDAGFSGGKLERPAMDKLIREAEAGKFDTVAVYKLDRLSRSVQDTLHLIRDVFKEHDINFVCLQENIDTKSAMGNLFLTLLSAIAEFEREQITERMAMGRHGRAKSGKSMMWARPAYGYRYDRESQTVSVVQSEATIVKRIYKEYLEGKSVSKIKNDLNSEGHITKEKPWVYKRITYILQSRVYTGVNEYKGEIYDGKHEAIIDTETFELTQMEFAKRQQQTKDKKNNPRPFQAKYMLSGLARCGYCKAPLKLRLGAVRKDGTRAMVYDCHNRWNRKVTYLTIYNDNKQCTESGRYQKADLEAYVLDKIKELQLNPDTIREKMDLNEKPTANTEEIKKQIAKTNQQIDKLNDLYLNDLITVEKLKERANKLKKERELLEAELSKNSDHLFKAKKKQLNDLLMNKDIDSMTYEEQRNLVKMLIYKVDVTKEDINIIFDF
ncbi:TPA: recombinase family protein [Streptococcus pyogenes]|uniref:recombinase family protein n=1 Tax=Streptococcus pyogenes TaxID=1314 RepID=UPI00109CC5C1|nr:recombinase family protein [Streptococcus pyogenes]QCK44282.1 recombinase family protein [Streptococcus pyogenes]VHG20114.1 site-specific recombinase/resolvase [Streptococcus pyogenes]VHK26263.1 site-specific recombinase/resolvase [Streptococcus pyogenes]HEP1482184.1 recombinase family protein [Streptococcus pyogenes]HEP1679833.1 recombinase family protein [Streptococcus pyogenes]